MHFLLQCDELMQLVISYIHDEQASIWLRETTSEWYLRLIQWAPGYLPESVKYAYQVGDVAKITKNSLALSKVRMNEWHIKTWHFFAQNHLIELQNHIDGVSSIQSPTKLLEILPFFKLETADLVPRMHFLCVAIQHLDLNTFQKLYCEYKLDCSQQLLCMIAKKGNCDKKSILKWLVDQLKTTPDELTSFMRGNIRFEDVRYYIVKYLILSCRMDMTTRNNLFHHHIWQAHSGDLGKYFQKMTLVLWHDSIYIGNYLTPATDQGPDAIVFLNYNCRSKFSSLTDDDEKKMESDDIRRYFPSRKRKIISRDLDTKGLLTNVWVNLPKPSTNCDMEVEYAGDIESDPDDFIDIENSDDEVYDGHENFKFTEVSGDDDMYPSQIESIKRNLHDTVCNHMTSGLAHAFMSNMEIVHSWTSQEFCSAFQNTCKNGHRSLTCILWNLAPNTLHPMLCKYFVHVLKHNDTKFLEFAWDRAPEVLSRSVFAAARHALLYRHSKTWHFLFTKGLLTESVLFDDEHQLWYKSCFTPPDFLQMVWKDTPMWRSHFDLMIETALAANKRWIVMFLNKQQIVLDQTWLRQSIVKLTRLNLFHLLKQIHEPQTLPLKEVQMCYEALQDNDFRRVTEWWWTFFPLTREQLLRVPNFEWHNVNSVLMQLLWSQRIANADDMCAYHADKDKHILDDFDIDLETWRMMNTK